MLLDQIWALKFARNQSKSYFFQQITFFFFLKPEIDNLADIQSAIANANREASVTTAIDSNSPLYIHPSDTLGSVLISEQLIGTQNYGIRSWAMTIFLWAKNKLGFVDGSCHKSTFNPILHTQREQCNSLVLAWIFNMVSKEIFNGIVYSTSAYQVWQGL